MPPTKFDSIFLFADKFGGEEEVLGDAVLADGLVVDVFVVFVVVGGSVVVVVVVVDSGAGGVLLVDAVYEFVSKPKLFLLLFTF